MKYTIRKLLTLSFVVAAFFGPGVFRTVKDIVAPSPEIRIARAIEAHESNLDVVNVLAHGTEVGKVVVIIQLDNRSYWSGSSRTWTNVLAFILSTVKENGYTGAFVFTGWYEGQVDYVSVCDNLRAQDCTQNSMSPQAVFTPWLGKGNP